MKSKVNILWICGIAWLHKDNRYFPEATYPGIVSGSAFQQAIIEGLESQDYNVRILSDCDMSSGKRVVWSHNGKSNDIRVAGNGNKILRIPSKIYHLCSEIKNGDVLKKIDYAFVYEMHLPYLICLSLIKRINPKITTVFICPDLSIHMDLDLTKKPVKGVLKQIEYQIEKKLLRHVDGFVLFTKQMSEFFKDYDKPFTVVEGVYRDKFSLKEVKKENYIMHAGSLHYNTGIEELISAFEKLEDSDIELRFFGSGALDDYIKEKSRNNPRIKHMGFVDPQMLFEYEKQALLLVNVRNPKEEYTKYSFPSKTFEYMASGTPFLTTDLPGIPKEYKEYLIVINNNSVDEIKQGLDYVLKMTNEERTRKGLSARDFVLNHKNKTVQSKRIIELLRKI